MKLHSNMFDFSDYPLAHPLHSNINKKVLDKFKDELNSDVAHQFIGLKAKMYSLKTKNTEKKEQKVSLQK